MYRFFVDKNQIGPKSVVITGSDVNHIKNVLRMKEGEEVSVMTEGDTNEYRCEVAVLGEDTVELTLLFVKESDVELSCKITLFQGLPKNDKMELIIQKAVELGASAIVPVATKRAVVKLDGAKENKKIARWQGISEAAAKQSKRAYIPEVSNVMNMKEALAAIRDYEVKLIPYEMCDADSMIKTKELISNIKPNDRVAVFIGPEGGFTEEEIELAKEAGVIPITLGHRILRTETAGFTVLSWIMYEVESSNAGIS